MRRIFTLYGSSVGKKTTMAVSGLVMVGYLFGHMTGNLKAFLGTNEAGIYHIDEYAEFLRTMGEPVLPEGFGLWCIRLLMLALIGMHIVSATQLYLQSRAARTTRYAKEESISFSYASRTMRWGGVIILLYIIYHLLHMTVGSVHPDFAHGAVYHNLVIGFQSPLVVGAYTVATLALGLHLYHGLWSIFQTLGASHPRYDHLRRPFAAVLTFVIVGGFLSVPFAALMGVLR